MKRDWDLIRNILAKLEDAPNSKGMLPPNAFEGYGEPVVSYHYYLLDQAGLVEATCSKAISENMHCFAKSLTWNGHEFLDAIRNDNVWKKVKGEASSKGLDLSFDTIKAIAAAVAKTILGL